MSPVVKPTQGQGTVSLVSEERQFQRCCFRCRGHKSERGAGGAVVDGMPRRTRQRPLRPRRAIVDRITAPALPDLLVFQWTFKMEFLKCNICPFLEVDFESFKALFTANNYHPNTPEGHIRPPGDTFTISDSSSFVLSPGPEIL